MTKMDDSKVMGGPPYRWLVYFMENPMITGGSPILGNPNMAHWKL